MYRYRAGAGLAAIAVAAALALPGVARADEPVSHFTALDQFAVPSTDLVEAAPLVDPTRRVIYSRYDASREVVAIKYHSQVIKDFRDLTADSLVMNPTTRDVYAVGASHFHGKHTGLAVVRGTKVRATYTEATLGGYGITAVNEFNGTVAVLVYRLVKLHHVTLSLVELDGTTILRSTPVCHVRGSGVNHSEMDFDASTGRLYVECPGHGHNRPHPELEIYKAGEQIGLIDSVPNGRVVMDSGHSYLYVVGQGGATVIRGFHVVAQGSLGTANGFPFNVHQLLLDPVNGNLYVSDAGRVGDVAAPQVAILHAAHEPVVMLTSGAQLGLDPATGLVYVSRQRRQPPDPSPGHGVQVIADTTMQPQQIDSTASVQSFDPVTGDVLGSDPAGMTAIHGQEVAETVDQAMADPELITPIPGHARLVTIGAGWLTRFKTTP
jgi:hypothetical protein